MPNNDLKAIKVVVKGRIQGVGYRANTHKKATQLGITGYIRSVQGREIELVAEGKEEALEELIEFLEEGPSGAEIEECQVEWIEVTDEFIRFSIKY